MNQIKKLHEQQENRISHEELVALEEEMKVLRKNNKIQQQTDK